MPKISAKTLRIRSDIAKFSASIGPDIRGLAFPDAETSSGSYYLVLRLDGDGGFHVETDKEMRFNPFRPVVGVRSNITVYELRMTLADLSRDMPTIVAHHVVRQGGAEITPRARRMLDAYHMAA